MVQDFEKRKEAAPALTDRPFLCAPHNLGCGREVGFKDYHHKALVCNDCADRNARDYDVERETVGNVNVGNLLPWYEAHFPTLKPMPFRHKARVLALAGGCDGIRHATAAEREEAAAIASETRKKIGGKEIVRSV